MLQQLSSLGSLYVRREDRAYVQFESTYNWLRLEITMATIMRTEPRNKQPTQKKAYWAPSFVGSRAVINLIYFALELRTSPRTSPRTSHSIWLPQIDEPKSRRANDRPGNHVTVAPSSLLNLGSDPLTHPDL